MRKRIRRQQLAKQFGVSVRTIDEWWKGRPDNPKRPRALPPPHYLSGSPIPFWYDDEIPEGNQTK